MTGGASGVETHVKAISSMICSGSLNCLRQVVQAKIQVWPRAFLKSEVLILWIRQIDLA